MGLFSKPGSYLGVDFDQHSLKLVELRNEGGRPRLVTYAYYDRQIKPQGQKGQKIGQAIDLADNVKLLKAVMKKAKVSTSKAISAIPSSAIFSSVLNLPDIPKKDLASAIKWEAKKVVPMDVDDMILDWQVLDTKEAASVSDEKEEINESSTEDTNGGNEEQKKDNSEADKKLPNLGNGRAKGKDNITHGKKVKHTKVLLTAAPKDLVKKYIETFRQANLNLLSIDTEPFALVRSLVGRDASALMLVDLGSTVTNISVIEAGVPVIIRSLNVGGLTVTKSIANSLNVNMARAEQFKYDVGIARGTDSKNDATEVPQTIRETLQPIVDELKYIINLYQNQSAYRIEKIVLTGGSALLVGLPDYLSEQLNLRAYVGDPWARVAYPEDLKPVLHEVGPRLSVAIGLAMRDIG